MTQITDILAERDVRYGNFIGHANITQALKHAIDHHLRTIDKSLAPDQQEALDMILHKIGRIVNGDPNYHDSWLDIAGYAMLVANRLELEAKHIQKGRVSNGCKAHTNRQNRP